MWILSFMFKKIENLPLFSLWDEWYTNYLWEVLLFSLEELNQDWNLGWGNYLVIKSVIIYFC